MIIIGLLVCSLIMCIVFRINFIIFIFIQYLTRIKNMHELLVKMYGFELMTVL